MKSVLKPLQKAVGVAAVCAAPGQHAARAFGIACMTDLAAVRDEVEVKREAASARNRRTDEQVRLFRRSV